jgi:hypothetical protein
LITPFWSRSRGNEKVLLFNASNQPLSLEQWAVANTTKKKHLLTGTIGAGESLVISMPRSVPLSNKGGIITLLDAAGLKVHGVSYTKAQAKREGFWLTF